MLMSPKSMRLVIALGLAGLFRLAFGVCLPFWNDDPRQIYLLGLKYFATGKWPFFGPDVIHTDSQIPGALQALLIGLPLRVLALPETPFVVLNLLSIGGLIFLVRFTFPRFREDQLQKLAWTVLIPISLVNILATTVLKVAF